MISSSNNEESFALLDLIPSRCAVGKRNIWAFIRTDLYSVKLIIILDEIFIYPLESHERR